MRIVAALVISLTARATAHAQGVGPIREQSGDNSHVPVLNAQSMEQLRDEYERRVNRDGLTAANQWLSREAYRLGQEAAEMLSQ